MIDRPLRQLNKIKLSLLITLLITIFSYNNAYSQCAGVPNWSINISTGGATWTSPDVPYAPGPNTGCLTAAHCGQTINVYVCNKFSQQFKVNTAFDMGGGVLPFQDSYNDPAGAPWPDYKYKRVWQSSNNGTSNWMKFGSNPTSITLITDDYSPVKYYRCVLVTDDGKTFYDRSSTPTCEIKFRVVHSTQWQTAPFGTKTTNVTATSFRAEWDALTQPTWTENTGVDGEAVQLTIEKEQPAGSGTWVTHAVTWVPGGQSATFYDVTGLTAGTKYRWCARKSVINGMTTAAGSPTPCFTPGLCSVWREVTVGGATPPPPPVDPPVPGCPPNCPPVPPVPPDTIPTAPPVTTCDSIHFLPVNDTTNVTVAGFTYKGKLNGKRYYVSTANANWATAKTNCEAIGGGAHLATLTSAVENDSVNTWITANAWIGLSDAAVETTYSWVTSETFSYSKVSGNTPALDYAYMTKALNNWTFADGTASLQYACEIDSADYVYKYARNMNTDTRFDTIIDVYRGDTVNLQVNPIGEGTIEFQWQKDGEYIIGANQNAYSFKSFDVEDVNFNTNEAVYTVRMKNTCGILISRKFIIRYAGCR
ncbi:MAG: hypothetical protein A2X12_08830 [Bacteroidetes bacterium GWE2_29_8]|nr:MAG: hypothetical protein A2X12_08830 [Bacteroidetes bacterium GWE2_29_8]